MNNFLIRRADKKDIETLVNFNEAMAIETENKILDIPTLTNGVTRLLQNPENGFYLLAEVDGEVCASLMITTEWSDWRDGIFWWVQSVFVVPAQRRKGLYSMMYNHVKELANANPDVCGFRLYVDKENAPAQSTYEKCGMEKTNYLLYEEITRK
ncbi:MAG: GNAT family N-acetyltransferase [Bacteroidetes bacterium]|nr:GNAT family N-acetyltransferase [Bacteroidota bacterium]